MCLTDASKVVPLRNASLYTRVEYYGPAYDAKANTKLQLDGINNERLIVTNKGLEELAQELKARVLSLGEGKDPRITQWVSEEIEKELHSQGFTFTPKPEKSIVEFSHPTGLSGNLSFAPFTVGDNYDFNPKFPNLQFPTDIERKKAVLFTLDRPNYREPYTKGFSANEPQKVIDEIRGFLAIALVHQEVGQAWKSDLLVPKFRQSKLRLVNPELDPNKSIFLELTWEKNKLILKCIGEETEEKLSYPLSNTPTVVDVKEITQAIVERAERHIQLRKNVAQVYKEVCGEWKSDILIPKLIGDKLKLVNTEFDGEESIILELTVECDKLRLNGRGESYEISDDPREIAQTIVGLAEKHVQKFIHETGYIQPTTIVREVPELDL
jgi:putative sterol carrier protein